ncbi:MAG: hypothetical protein HY319_03210 [Armatimonadetes bacterium]|nr:hypothetical protein [Armatimonadota bacterium]
MSIVRITAYVLVALITSAFLYNQTQSLHRYLDFGWEYGNIAANLASGRGFSGPFGVSDQPTAWMPPLLVWVMAGIFTVLGTKSTAAAWALMLLQLTELAVSVGILVHLGRRTVFASSAGWLVPIVAVYVWLDRVYLLGDFHDIATTILLSCLALAALERWLREERTGWLYGCALIIPLANPVLAAAMTGIVLGRALVCRDRRRAALVATALVVLSAGTWTVRNYLVMSVPAPIKSNFWFDLWLANTVDEDGILTSSTFAFEHPIHPDSPAGRRYTELGEARFIADCRRLGRLHLQESPGGFAARIARRLRNALFWMDPEHDIEVCLAPLLAPDEQQRLMDCDLIWMGGAPCWMYLGRSPEDARARIGKVGLRDPEAAYSSWLASRRLWSLQHRSWEGACRSLVHGMLPLLTMALGLLTPAVRREPAFQIAVGLYGLYLLPYIAISHYARYQLGLLGIQALVVWFALASAVGMVRQDVYGVRSETEALREA